MPERSHVGQNGELADREEIAPLLEAGVQRMDWHHESWPPGENPEFCDDMGKAHHLLQPTAPDLATAEVQWSHSTNMLPSDPPQRIAKQKISRSPSSFLSIQDIVENYYSEGSIRGSVFNLCSATLGAGCLSVPFAVRGTGVAVGALLLIGVAIATAFSIHLIIQTRLHSGFKNYGDIAHGIFGPVVGVLLELSVVCFCFGTGVAYCKTLRDILVPVLDVVPSQYTYGLDDKEAMLLLWAVALLPLSLLKSLSSLRFSSLFGVASILYVAVAVTLHCIFNMQSGKVKPKWDTKDMWVSDNWNDVILSLPIYLFAFTCQVNVLDVWDDLAQASRSRMSKVTWRSMILCLLIYMSVGIFGYIEFGKKTCGNILQSYEAEIEKGAVTIILMYVFIALTLLMAFPLVVLPCRHALMSVSTRVFGYSGGHVFWTLVVAGGAVSISLWVDDVRQVFQLVGASCSALVCFVFPPSAALRLNILITRDKWGAWALLIGGVAVGVLGTIVTLQDIIHPSNGRGCT